MTFTELHLAAVLAVCDAWWEAFIRVAWETGLRRGDLLNLEWGQLDEDGTLRVVLMKNGVEFVGNLSPQAAAALRVVRRPGDRFVFTAKDIYVSIGWKRLLRRAGIADAKFADIRVSWLRRRSEN